jgi:hypothetical protein
MQLLASLIFVVFQIALTIVLTIVGLIVSAFYMSLGAIALLCMTIYNLFTKPTDNNQE